MLYLGKISIYQNESWHTSSSLWSECTCHIWEQHQLQVMRVMLKSYDDVRLVIFDPTFKCIDGIDTISWQNLDLLKRNLVHFISTMIWGHMPNLETVPTTGLENSVQTLWWCESNDFDPKLEYIKENRCYILTHFYYIETKLGTLH